MKDIQMTESAERETEAAQGEVVPGREAGKMQRGKTKMLVVGKVFEHPAFHD